MGKPSRTKTFKEKTNNWIKNNSIVFIISLIIITISSLVGFAENSIKIYIAFNSLESRIMKYKTAQTKIDNLGVGQQLAYFKSSLNEPVVINKQDPFYFREEINPICNNLKEYIFIDNLFFVQALVDNETSSVFGFAVTSRDGDFKPKMYGFKINDDYFQLDQDNVGSEHNVDYSVVNSTLTSKYFYYNEVRDFGNPGLYLNYYFAQSPAAENHLTDNSFSEIGNLDSFEENYNKNGREQYLEDHRDKLQKFRRNSTFNTVGVEYSTSFECYRVGPDWNQARLLRKNPFLDTIKPSL